MNTYPERREDHGFVVDRRRNPDRRTEWRGGRRDSDWLNRPPGAWEQLSARRIEPSRWRTLLSSLHLW